MAKRKRKEQMKDQSAKRHSCDNYADETLASAANVAPLSQKCNADQHQQPHDRDADKTDDVSLSDEVVKTDPPAADCVNSATSVDIRASPGFVSDDLTSLCSEVSGNRDHQWSFEMLKNAPADIARVQKLISHLMLVGMSKKPDDLNANSDDSDSGDSDSGDSDSGDDLTHAERRLCILHDQCHAMLKGLHRHLALLFHHFKYTPLT